MFTSKAKRIQPTEDIDKGYQKIGKKLYQTSPEYLFDYLHIYLIRRNSRNYQNEENRITKLIYWKMCQRN